jgi:phenylacetate-CoA ligase
MIWNETMECMDREQLREVQGRRLKKMVDYVYHNTPFYRKKFQEMGLLPDDIQGIDDIVKLPFTNKLDLRDNYPFGFAAVPMSQIVRIHASSGTTGNRSWPSTPATTWPSGPRPCRGPSAPTGPTATTSSR